MRLVLDASVIVKWLLADPSREQDTESATRIMEAVRAREVELLQPPHWLAEVAAVMCRLSSQTASEDVRLLGALNLAVESDEQVFFRACELSMTLDHHLFDTLYHALALEREYILVTADVAYRNKAGGQGGICLLRDFC